MHLKRLICRVCRCSGDLIMKDGGGYFCNDHVCVKDAGIWGFSCDVKDSNYMENVIGLSNMHTVDQITAKGSGKVWYIVKKTEDSPTIWFQKQDDRDYYVKNGEIETSPGKDEHNLWFKSRKSSVSVATTTSQNTVKTVQTTSIIKTTTKDRLIKLHKELGEILDEL